MTRARTIAIKGCWVVQALCIPGHKPQTLFGMYEAGVDLSITKTIFERLHAFSIHIGLVMDNRGFSDLEYLPALRPPYRAISLR